MHDLENCSIKARFDGCWGELGLGLKEWACNLGQILCGQTTTHTRTRHTQPVILRLDHAAKYEADTYYAAFR